MKLQRISSLTGNMNELDIPNLSEARLSQYLLEKSACPSCSLTDLLPELSEYERLFVHTGVTDEEWAEFDGSACD